MKKILLSLVLLSILIAAKGQNLVNNGDFEQHNACPTGVNQLSTSQYWTNPAGLSPDYYHKCGSAGVSPPDCVFGYQDTHNDSAIGGIGLWWSAGLFREYLQTSLTSQLTAGTCYHFEMYVNFANNNRYATDAMGVYFSNVAITGVSNLIGYTPQISNTVGFITDTLNWTLLSGNFTATGNENFLIIGNFKDDASTDTMMVNPNGSVTFTYYYFDDVSLTPCTGIEEQNENAEIKVYPNPAQDELLVNGYSSSEEKEVIITDVSGRKVLTQSISNQSLKINVQSLNAGIYFIEINGSNPDGQRDRKKFLKR
ncbi:MAG TPA: T9SS type A sorting domain-containing protein [Bacteroidia bacterium]|nr:T9SS type A sorting domain-containing protein [Bacteroidia bacterium]